MKDPNQGVEVKLGFNICFHHNSALFLGTLIDHPPKSINISAHLVTYGR